VLVRVYLSGLFHCSTFNSNEQICPSNLGRGPRRSESKSPLVTMARSKFAPESTPSRGPIAKPHYLPHPWTRPTCDAKRHPDPIRRFPQCTGQTDAPTDRPTDRPRESLMTILTIARYASNESDAA